MAAPPPDAGGRWTRERRLLRRPAFRAAYEQGRRSASRHFTLFGLPRPPRAGESAGCDRFGITVSRKLGTSVVRNRIRRRTREMLRRLVASGGGGPCDIVVNPRASVAVAQFDQLMVELAREVERLRQVLAAASANGPAAQLKAPPASSGPATQSSPVKKLRR